MEYYKDSTYIQSVWDNLNSCQGVSALIDRYLEANAT
jgi:hypothetical protein